MPRKQRRRSWGCITEKVKGKKYVIRWVEDTPQGRRRCCETFHGTYREADRRLAEIRMRSGDEAPTVTLGEAWENWYHPSAEQRIRAGKLKRRSLDQYIKVWKGCIADRWGACPVTEIRAVDVEEWLHTMTKATGKTVKAIMSNVLNECLKREVVQRNVMRVKMVESSLGTEIDKGIWTLDQLDELAWRSRGELFFYSVILMAFGSCRPGESLGPMLDEVSRKECGGMVFAKVEVNRQVLRSGEPSADSDLKNEWSPRTVYVPEPWCYPLFERVVSAGEYDRFVTDSGLGTNVSQQRIYGAWNRAFKSGRMGNLERHPWKNLRPSWETWMNWRNKVSEKKIEKIMGHKVQGVTGVYYDRPLDDQLMEEIADSFRRHPYESPYRWT